MLFCRITVLNTDRDDNIIRRSVFCDILTLRQREQRKETIGGKKEAKEKDRGNYDNTTKGMLSSMKSHR